MKRFSTFCFCLLCALCGTVVLSEAATTFRNHVNAPKGQTTLASGISAVQTSITVSAGGGVLLPDVPFAITIGNEILNVSNKATDTLTVTRGFDNSTASTHNAGDPVYNYIIAKDLDDIHSAITGIESGSTTLSSVKTSTTAIIGTDIRAGATITAGTGMSVTTGPLNIFDGDIYCADGAVSASGSIVSSAGSIRATSGSIDAGNGFVTDNGSYVTNHGDVTAGDDIIAYDDMSCDEILLDDVTAKEGDGVVNVSGDVAISGYVSIGDVVLSQVPEGETPDAVSVNASALVAEEGEFTLKNTSGPITINAGNGSHPLKSIGPIETPSVEIGDVTLSQLAEGEIPDHLLVYGSGIAASEGEFTVGNMGGSMVLTSALGPYFVSDSGVTILPASEGETMLSVVGGVDAVRGEFGGSDTTACDLLRDTNTVGASLRLTLSMTNDDATPDYVNYARLQCNIEDPDSELEDGKLSLQVMRNGSAVSGVVVSGNTGMVSTPFDVTVSGGAISAGEDGSERGILTAWDGSGGNKPGCVTLASPAGGIWYLFVEDDGTLKVTSSMPTANTDGSVVGQQE